MNTPRHTDTLTTETPRLKLSTTHSDGGIVSFRAVIVKREADGVWVRIPEKVRRLPFPPYGGKKFVKFSLAYAAKWEVSR